MCWAGQHNMSGIYIYSLYVLQSKNLHKFYEIKDLINDKAISSGFQLSTTAIYCYFKERESIHKKLISIFYIILTLLNRHIADEVSNIHKYLILCLSEKSYFEMGT